MDFFATLLFACSANLDNIALGLVFSLRRVRIGLCAYGLISLIISFGTFCAMCAGHAAAQGMSLLLARTLGGVMLLFMGLYFVVSFAAGRAQEEQKVPHVAGSKLPLGEAASVACALMLNNLGMGICASVAGFRPVLTSCITFFISLAALLLGERLGKTRLARELGRYALPISGVILLLLGLWQLIFGG